MKETILLTDGYKLNHRCQYLKEIKYRDQDKEDLPSNVTIIGL